MMNLVKNIISVCLVLVLMPATGGVTIYHHICNIDGEHNTALFSQTSCSHHQHDHCDCAELPQNECNLEESEHCFEFVEYILLDAKFVLEKALEITNDAIHSTYISFNDSLQFKKSISLTAFIDKSSIPIAYNIAFQNFQSRNKTDDDIC